MSDDDYRAGAPRRLDLYPCGLRAGERLRLRRVLFVRDHEGRATGRVHVAGEIWTVAPGAAHEPSIVWLAEPDGSPHTWDDDAIFADFERVS